MSSRALRKAQREREEQEQLRRLEQSAPEESEEDELPTQPVQKSAFAMLEVDEDEAEDGGVPLEPSDEEEGQAQEPTTASIPKPPSKKKKKRKKGKSTPAADPAEQSEQLDEIDQALKQLSTNGNTSLPGATSAGIDHTTDETSNLLAIDTNHLHAQNEMRRLFGRAALEQQDEDEPPQNANIGGNRRQQRRVQQMGLAQALRGQGGRAGGGLSAIALKRNIFIQGKDTWPVAASGGLGMEIEEKRADGTVLYRFVHNRIYQDVQAQFEIAVESMDPNQLVALLQHNPFHVSTLLQVSEIAKQERDHTTSGDLLERALFSFGRAVHSTFAKTLADGKVRLDFARPENREFWLASWRYMQNLSMRATWRTVYEWAKLLLSLSPEEDPYALWLVLDQYALRARQDLDYINISRNKAFQAVHKSAPNVQLSSGLAEFRAGNKGKGRQALFTAVGKYPWVVARLMQELSLDPPPSVWGKEARTEKEKLLSELYCTCAKDLWNTPETSALLVEVASALPPDTPSAEPNNDDISQNEARHVLLSDTPALIALIPRRYTANISSSSDPLPPSNSYPSYLPPRRSPFSASRSTQPRPLGTPTENIRELNRIHGFLQRIFPFLQHGADPAAMPPIRELRRDIESYGISEEDTSYNTLRAAELLSALQGVNEEDIEDEEERRVWREWRAVYERAEAQRRRGDGERGAEVEDGEEE